MKRILLLLIFMSVTMFAQEKSPEKILDKVKEEFAKIEDYSVDAEISVDVNFLKMPKAKAKIYFKNPDKIKMESNGFAMLPKQGINYSPAKFLEIPHSAIWLKEEEIDGYKTDVIKVIPTIDTMGIVLTTLWVDKERHLFRKIESTTKTQGTLTIDLEYENGDDHCLPTKVIFGFSVAGMQIPQAMTGEFGNQGNWRKKKKEPMSGSISIIYSNYNINTGLEDSFFDKPTDDENNNK